MNTELKPNTKKGLAAAVIGGMVAVGVYLMIRSSAVSSCEPYIAFVNAAGVVNYYRFDGAPRPLTHFPPGHDMGSGGGGDHAQIWSLNFGAGNMEVPTASGVICPDGYPCTTYPAPPVDVLVEHQPPPPNNNVTLCDKYRQENGPHAKPCPSGFTIAAYSAAIKAMPQWIPPGSSCGHFPTPTPTGGTPAPTVSATVIPPPPTFTLTAVPTASSSPTVTRTKTRTPTPTKTPCRVCVACTPTRTPCIGPQSGCPTPTPSRTPHIGPAPTHSPTPTPTITPHIGPAPTKVPTSAP